MTITMPAEEKNIPSPIDSDFVAAETFEKCLGWPRPFPENLNWAYSTFMRAKASIAPGRLTAEGYAAIHTLAKLAENIFK